MKIARVPSKKRNILTLIILIVGLPLVVFASYQTIQLVTKASADTEPKNVLLSNLTTSSVTITWTTDSQVRGTVSIVKNGTEESPVIDTRGNTKRYTHFVELTGLEPNTSYSFVITSGTTNYSKSESRDLVFKTASITADTPTPNPIHGTVSDVSGDDVLVIAELKDKSVYPVSATMPSGGNWIMDLSAFRKVSDNSLVLSDNDTNLVLVVVAGSTSGDIVSGSYSDLFDSNGKLKDTQTFDISESAELFTYFPSESMLKTTVVATTNTETKTNTETNTDTKTSDNEDKVTVPVVEETTDGRVFRIVKDLSWEDMITSSASTWSYGASTVQITNLTDTGFTVVWVSQSSEQGYLNYGTTSSDLSNQANDERDGVTNKGSYYVHSVPLTRLQPSVKYYFEVVSGSKTYDNSGKKYTATTFATLSTPPSYVSITGTVSNLPESKEGVVLAYIKDLDSTGSSGQSGVISTLTDENGKWILSVADSRTSDGSGYFEYTSSDNMYFDILSTIPSFTPITVPMNGITSKDISIKIDDSKTTSTVGKLSNYGVI
jgi:hypothetical protein